MNILNAWVLLNLKARNYAERKARAPTHTQKKFQRDSSRTIIGCADREIKKDENSSSLQPDRIWKRRRTDSFGEPGASDTSRPNSRGDKSTSRPRKTWRYSEGAHTFTRLNGKSREWSYCSLAKNKKPAYCSTACQKCSRWKGSLGVHVCVKYWATRGFALWHNAEFPTERTNAMGPKINGMVLSDEEADYELLASSALP